MNEKSGGFGVFLLVAACCVLPLVLAGAGVLTAYAWNRALGLGALLLISVLILALGLIRPRAGQ